MRKKNDSELSRSRTQLQAELRQWSLDLVRRPAIAGLVFSTFCLSMAGIFLYLNASWKMETMTGIWRVLAAVFSLLLLANRGKALATIRGSEASRPPVKSGATPAQLRKLSEYESYGKALLAVPSLWSALLIGAIIWTPANIVGTAIILFLGMSARISTEPAAFVAAMRSEPEPASPAPPIVAEDAGKKGLIYRLWRR